MMQSIESVPSLRGVGCLSHLRCDQWLNGELDSGTEDSAITAHLATCQRCTAMVAAHRRERAAFAVPLRLRQPGRRWMAWTASALAAAACLSLVLWLRRDAGDTRSKGRPAIGFYVKHRDVVRRGGPGEIVAPHDAINFVASTEQASYLAIISIDGARRVSVYYPDGPAAAAVSAGSDQLLPRSVVLDDVLGRERLAGVFCDRPVPVDQLAAAVGAGAALPTGCVADRLTIDKRPERPGESRAGESPAGESPAGESRAGESRAGESRAGESRDR